MEQRTPETERTERGFQNRSYEVEGARINVARKEFSPMPKEERPLAEILQDEAILFLPGWGAKDAGTLNHLTQCFANDSGKTALSITTSAEKNVPDSLYKEAKAIRSLIVERGLKKIILAAYSQGGSKAANLIAVLQKENPDVDVQGLILLAPAGLYEQGKVKLAAKFIRDTMVNTPITLARKRNLHLIKKGIQASTDVTSNIVREAARDKATGYPKRLWSQIGEMARANIHYQDIKCPVVLIQGKQDLASSPEKVMPNAQDPKSSSERGEILKKTFFPNSPRVYMVVAEKLGHHELPHFRADQISEVAFGLLRRYWREQAVPVQPASPASPSQTWQG